VLEDHNYQIDVNAKLGHDDDKTEFIENAHATLDARQDVFTHYRTWTRTTGTSSSASS